MSSTPALTHVIHADDDREVVGVASLDNRLFVLHNPSKQHIDVYDSEAFQQQQSLKVNDLSDDTTWNGLTTCVINKFLYVSDHDEAKVYKVQLAIDSEVLKWSVGRRPMGLSTNAACNLLVACFDDEKILEYTTNGAFVREIHLQLNDDEFLNPWHAIQLTNGHFVVSCGDVNSESHVFEVDVNGRVLATCSNQLKSTSKPEFSWPRHFAVDKNNELIYVLDCWKNRVVILNRSLDCTYEMLIDGGFHTPSCIHFNESQDRIFIGERCNHLSNVGRRNSVLVFDNII